MNIVKRQINDLIECTIRLRQSYEIWWELVNPANKSKNKKVILKYTDFFAAVADAHFLSICIGIYQLFDKRKNVISIPNILMALKSSDPDLASDMESKISPHWGVITKIFDIRGNVYAHRNASHNPGAIFTRAGLTPAMIGSCVSLAEEVTSTLAEEDEINFKHEVIAEYKAAATVVVENFNQVIHILNDA